MPAHAGEKGKRADTLESIVTVAGGWAQWTKLISRML